MIASLVLELFAEEFKIARTEAGLTQAQVGELVNYSPTMVAKIETCERRPSRDFAQRCDEVFEARGRFERMQRKLSREVMQVWLREWAAIEAESIALRTFQPMYVAGLLQTEAYARAVFSSRGILLPQEIDQHVAARLDRQEILTSPKPPLLTVVLDEAVLRRSVGGPAVMREQLDHLVRVGTSQPRVRIHVVPNSVGAYAGLDGPLVMATPAAGDDLVYVEGPIFGHTYDSPEDVRAATQVWESIRCVALSQQQSLELIAEVAKTWT